MNLATRYLGLDLQNPLIVGASPLCDDVAMVQSLQEAGAAALVMRSLFEEQITSASSPPNHNRGKREAEQVFPEFASYQQSPDAYLRQIERLKKSVTIPVIASLNAQSTGRWTDYASRIADAGADAIELNSYRVVADPSVATDSVETHMLEVVGSINRLVRIPVAVKISPYHTSVAQLAVALDLAGAAGLVLFNRFYQPDIDIDDLEVQPLLRLSDPGELLLRLRWVAIVSPLVRGSLCASGGIHTPASVVKSLLTGAHAVQVVSAVLKHGPRVLETLRDGLETWMSQHDQFRGSLNHERCRDAEAYERANYIRVLSSWRMNG
jgi:dihydroorotate dehydrogenase (fumarate)